MSGRRAARALSGVLRLPQKLHWRYFLVGVASAALIVLSYPYYSVWWLIFVALVPCVLGLATSRTGYAVASMGAGLTVVQVLFGMYWVSNVVTNFAAMPAIVGLGCLVVFSLFSEIQCFVFMLVAYVLLKQAGRRGPSARIAFAYGLLPIVYVGLDFMNPKIFPTTLGHVLYAWLPAVQIVEYTGVYWLTFPIVVANIALGVLLLHGLGRWAPSRWAARLRSRGAAAAGLPGPISALVALALVGGYFAWSNAWGLKRLDEIRALEKSFTRTFKASIIQGNIGDIDKLSSEEGYEPSIQHVLGVYRLLSKRSVERFHPDLLIWPETSFPFLYTHFADLRANAIGTARDQWMKDFIAEVRTPLFFGSYSSVNKRDYNTAFLVKPPFELASVYRKSILLAFGEYVPLGPLSPFILGLVPSIADFGRGPGPMIMDVAGAKLGPQICYEGIVPWFSRGSVQLGADVLLNITNDSWFGLSTEPWFHLMLTAFRTIELRRPLLRGTNTGFSLVVAPTGEQRYRTRLFEADAVEVTLQLPGEGQEAPSTFYLRHGELFAGFCQAVACAVLLTVFGPGLAAHLGQRVRSIGNRKVRG